MDQKVFEHWHWRNV